MLRPFNQSRPVAHPAMVESLEARALFAAAPHVTSIVTDNRGEVILNTQRSLDPATVNTRSVQLYSVGPDGIPLTADDVKMRVKPTYTESNRQLRIRTFGLEPDSTYWVKLSAKQITAFDGTKLDGEFNGAGVRTGNNVGGGDLLMVSKRDKGTSPVARFSTFYGGINVALNKTDAPGTVANFLHYANEAAWDGTFFHRTAFLGGPDKGIIQGGGFGVSADNQVVNIHAHDPIANEFGNSNVRGTIAMAKTDDPDSATNQWFFNVGDNSQALDDPNNSGGFTVFGNITGSGLAVMDAIAALQRVDLNGAPPSAFDETPVNDLNALQQRGQLDPRVDLVSVRRVAILNKVSALIVP